MNRDDVILLSMGFALVIIPPLVGYRIGRHLERKALTEALEHQIADVYMEGYGDGRKDATAK